MFEGKVGNSGNMRHKITVFNRFNSWSEVMRQLNIFQPHVKFASNPMAKLCYKKPPCCWFFELLVLNALCNSRLLITAVQIQAEGAEGNLLAKVGGRARHFFSISTRWIFSNILRFVGIRAGSFQRCLQNAKGMPGENKRSGFEQLSLEGKIHARQKGNIHSNMGEF